MKRICLLAGCIWMLIQPGLGQKATARCQDGGSGSDPVSEEVKRLDRELDDAATRGDSAVFQQLLAEAMINVGPEGTVTKKADVLRDIRPPKAGTKLSITAADIEVYVFGDTAIITSNKIAKWERSNGSSSDPYRETNTYVRKGGRWQLIASQQSHAPPPYTAKDVQLSLNVDEAQIGGNKKAAVVLIEFADYQCPYCRQFAAETMKQIERDYINTGRIGFIFRDFPIESSHPYAFKASVAAQCASQQGRLWEMNHKLLAEPMALTPDDLLSQAGAIKLDMTKFRQCFESEGAEGRVRQGMREASQLGIDGTPMFLVGIRKPGTGTIKVLRMIEGGYPYDVFKATLETLIAAHQ